MCALAGRRTQAGVRVPTEKMHAESPAWAAFYITAHYQPPIISQKKERIAGADNAIM
jgi:hypothetical protein